MNDEHMSNPEVAQEKANEQMRTPKKKNLYEESLDNLLLAASDLFCIASLIMENEKSGENEPVVGVLFTNYKSLVNAVSYLNIKTILQDELEIKEVILQEGHDGDWCKLYVNGSLIEEGHSLDCDVFCEILRTLGVMVHRQEVRFKDDGSNEVEEIINTLGEEYGGRAKEK